MQPNKTVNQRLDDIEKLLGTVIQKLNITDIESKYNEITNTITDKLDDFSNDLADKLKDSHSLPFEWLEICKYGMKNNLKPSTILQIMKVLNHDD